jgi:hypothetical protein
LEGAYKILLLRNIRIKDGVIKNQEDSDNEGEEDD